MHGSKELYPTDQGSKAAASGVRVNTGTSFSSGPLRPATAHREKMPIVTVTFPSYT